MRTSAACVGCHETYASPAAAAAHSHHAKDSPGNNCLECHMPRVTYALVKAIRTHQVESPSVATCLRTGRPLACNQCHLDKTLAWSAEHLERWYGQPAPPLDADEAHVAASILWLLRGDATQRGLTAWTMGWDVARKTSGEDWLPLYLGALLPDTYPVVRLMAFRSLRTLHGFEDLPFDFTGSEADAGAAFNETVRRWMASPRRTTGPEILIRPDGTPMVSELQRLADERDQRVIELDE
jgi:hypothetical protein